jgi:hypothetical protein
LEYILSTMKNAQGIVALACCVVAVCRAQNPPTVPSGLLACRKLPDASARVHCYDAQIDAMSPEVRNTPARAAAAPEQSAVAKFGAETLPASARPARPGQEVTLVASITAVSKAGPKTYLISLSNGQVWRQDGSQTTGFFKVGDDARIERGALGSYHMSTTATGAKNRVLVTRVR